MEKSMDFPHDFRCPISMEIMTDPVTISTGVTYERNNIEKWFFTYNKSFCPATMQNINGFDMFPNQTLKNLILQWRKSKDLGSYKHDELMEILGMIESSPFKVSLLRKLSEILQMGDEIMEDFKLSGGVEVMVKMIVQILIEFSDFVAFRACEEALGILDQLPFSQKDESFLQLLMEPNCILSMAAMLQRGSQEARFSTVSILQKMVKEDSRKWNNVVEDWLGIDFFKSLLEILSDENSIKASSCALQVLIEILDYSKKSRLKAIEAGGICTLVELLIDSDKYKCERIMQLIKLLCECADGRFALAEHGLGIAAVSEKLLTVSGSVTRIGVKILWLISGFHTSERVLNEMMVCGAVEKMVALLRMGGGGGGGPSTTTEKVVKILKLHGRVWRRYPCFQDEWKNKLVVGK